MSKPIRWHWPEGHEWQSTVPMLRDQDGKDIAYPAPDSPGWSKSYMATIAAAPLMMDLAFELIEALGDGMAIAMAMNLSDDGIATVKEAVDAMNEIIKMREEESNDA